MPTDQRFRGVFTPNIVPLDERGEINETELRRYTSWLIDHGVHGFYPNGSTGEFTRFTAEERRRIIAIMVDETRGRVPILAGAAEADLRETIKACEYYHNLGAQAVAVVAPFYFKVSPANVYAYFKAIGDHSPINVLLYNIPVFASPIDVATVERLAGECPRITGIKDSSGDLVNMMRMIRAVRPMRPDFTFLTGWEYGLVQMLQIGCDGGIHATSGVVPESLRKLYDLAVAKDYESAVALQYRLLPLLDGLGSLADFPEGIRAGVRHRGIRTGAGRQPISPEQKANLERAPGLLQKYLTAEGLA